MVYKYGFCVATIYLSVIAGLSEGGLSPKIIKACEEIYNPQVLTTPCCQQIGALAQTIASCVSKDCSSGVLSTCREVQCAAKLYDVETYDQIDKEKALRLIENLDKVDNETKAMNALVVKYCLDQDYTRFPAGDPSCDPWKYLNCVFFAYSIGCPQVNDCGKCFRIKQNLDICRTYADEYVSQLEKGPSIFYN